MHNKHTLSLVVERFFSVCLNCISKLARSDLAACNMDTASSLAFLALDKSSLS